MWIYKIFARNLTFVEFVKWPSGELIPIITKISYYDIYLNKIKQFGSVYMFDYVYLFLIKISIGFSLIAIIIIFF